MNPNTPFFSVIVPVYNVESYLAACVDSLLQQDFHSFEIVIVDDVSTDGSRAIAEEYAQQHPDKVRLVAHTVNLGLGGARNTGIDAAKGEFLLFLDSDDYLQTDTLKKIHQVIETENADIVEFCFRLVSEDGQYLRRTYCNPEVPKGHTAKAPLVTTTISACNKAIRAERMETVRFPEKRYYEDYWTIPKLLLSNCRIASLNEPLYSYRQRGSSIIHDTNTQKNYDIILGTDELLRYCREENVSAETMQELEFLAITHVLLNATLRVNGIDKKSQVQKELKGYMQAHFPQYRTNPFLNTLSAKQQRLLRLIEEERYGSLYVVYHIRNRITGALKAAMKRFCHK